jgi:hypothetical protein
MTGTMKKVDKQTRILLDEGANVRATVNAVLEKNRFDADLNNPNESVKRINNASFDSSLREKLPEIERITHSLLKVQEIEVAAHLLWPNKKIAEKITTNTVAILSQVYKRKFSFCNGKRLRCLEGGLFYLLGFMYDDPKKQREIAVALQITDVSIRLSYKRWLKEFPNLFQDVPTKLDQKLRHRCQRALSSSQTASICSRKGEDKSKNQNRLYLFDRILLEAIDESLIGLGENARILFLHTLEGHFKIKKQEIPSRISDFSNALERIFGVGARRLEILLMKNLHAKLGVTCEWPANEWPLSKWIVPEMTFHEYVRFMRESFEAENEDKIEVGALAKEYEEIQK